MFDSPRWVNGLLCSLLCLGLLVSTVKGAPNESQKQLKQIRQDLSSVSKLTKKQQFDEAETLLNQTEEQILKWQTSQELPESNRIVKGLKKLLTKRRDFLQMKIKAGGSSENRPDDQIVFSKSILPILAKNCFDCHSEEGKGELQLDTAEGFRKGGKSGKVVKSKNSRGSMLMQRLMTTNAGRRMPKNELALPREQLQLIDKWIMQGAVLDIKTGPFIVEKEKPTEVTIHKPTGDETVSFKKEIAPFMVRLCGGCHNDQQKRGGLSITTFRKLMQGGKSGEVLIPGALEKSRLFRLAGGLEFPRMPNNDSRLTRKNYEDLKKWIQEGIKFDGKDPDATLVSMVPSQAEMMQQRVAAMSDQELEQFKHDNSLQLWKRAVSAKEINYISTDNFVVYSDLDEERMKRAASIAEDQLLFVKKEFADTSRVTWRGKLALFITRSNIAYDEFATLLNERKSTEYPGGIVKVDSGESRSLIVVVDSGNQQTEAKPGLGFQLKQLVSEAYLQKGGTAVPRWFLRGYGQYLTLQAKKIEWSESPWVAKQQTDLKYGIGNLHQKYQGKGVLTQSEFLTIRELDMISFEAVNVLSHSKAGNNMKEFVKALQAGTSAQEGITNVLKTSVSRLDGEIRVSLRHRSK